MTTLVSAPPPTEPAPATPCHGEPDTVRAAAAGDVRAFEQLVHAHSRRVYGYLAHLTRNPHDAEDLTQQTFIKAHRHLATFDCRRPFIHWLLTIARRNALNHFRAARPTEPADETLPSSGPTPASALEASERTASLWARARRLLSPREYEVLWLRIAEEMSVADTARLVGLTQIHVKVIAHRARQRLLQGDLSA